MKRRRIIDLGDCLFCCSNSNFQTQNASQFPTHQTEQKRRRQKTRIKLDVAKVVHSLCRCELEFELQPNARVILQIKFEHGVGRIVYTITDWLHTRLYSNLWVSWLYTDISMAGSFSFLTVCHIQIPIICSFSPDFQTTFRTSRTLIVCKITKWNVSVWNHQSWDRLPSDTRSARVERIPSRNMPFVIKLYITVFPYVESDAEYYMKKGRKRMIYFPFALECRQRTMRINPCFNLSLWVYFEQWLPWNLFISAEN